MCYFPIQFLTFLRTIACAPAATAFQDFSCRLEASKAQTTTYCSQRQRGDVNRARCQYAFSLLAFRRHCAKCICEVFSTNRQKGSGVYRVGLSVPITLGSIEPHHHRTSLHPGYQNRHTIFHCSESSFMLWTASRRINQLD